jgi:Tol biopolymer transport system component
MKRLRFRVMALAVVVSTAGVGLAFSAPAGASGRGLIAFGSQRYGRTNNIFTMNADGSHVRQLTFLKKRDGADLRQQWSPDGTKLVFEHRNDAGTSRQLWLINADGTGKHRLLHDPGFLDFTPSYSPDGSRIAFERCLPSLDACALYSIDAHGNDLAQITPFDAANEIIDGSPKYSPDGTTIAFSSFNRDGVPASVYLIGATGGPITRLTPPALSAADPDWSPDGSRLVFWSNCCVPGQPAIWSIGADGSDPVKLSHPGSRRFNFSPDYSPDGTRIAYEWDLDDGSSNIATITVDGSNRTLIQRDAFLPVWQPIS